MRLFVMALLLMVQPLAAAPGDVPAALRGTWRGQVGPADFTITLSRTSCHIVDRYNHVEGTYPTRLEKQRGNISFLRIGREQYAMAVDTQDDALWYEDEPGTFCHHTQEDLPTSLRRVATPTR